MNNETNIADLLRSLRDETTTLVREEIALARTELSEKFSLLARNLAYLAMGSMIAASGLLLVLIGISILVGVGFSGQGMSTGTSAFLGFLIVATIVGVLGVSLITKSLKTLSDTSLKPDRSVRSLQKDKQWAKEQLS